MQIVQGCLCSMQHAVEGPVPVQSMEAAAACAGTDRETLQSVCAVVRLGCDVVFSLNVHGLSLHMEQFAEPWMQAWKFWLDFHSDALNESDAEVESAECALPLC
jgi:hypothetical protein